MRTRTCHSWLLAIGGRTRATSTVLAAAVLIVACQHAETTSEATEPSDSGCHDLSHVKFTKRWGVFNGHDEKLGGIKILLDEEGANVQTRSSESIAVRSGEGGVAFINDSVCFRETTLCLEHPELSPNTPGCLCLTGCAEWVDGDELTSTEGEMTYEVGGTVKRY